jgi:hypothetical protein
VTKALVCAECLDIRALDPDGGWTACRCGACEARWEDPARGTVRCRLGGHPMTREARERLDRCPLRIMGLHNAYLIPAIRGPSHEQMVEAGGQWEWWRKLAEAATRAPGYIFDAAMRATWATIVKVNETGDIKWEEYPKQPESLDDVKVSGS